MSEYASLSELARIRDRLFQDDDELTLIFTIKSLASCFSCVLDEYASPDTTELGASHYLDIARMLADVIERHDPTCEPWLAAMFGLATLRRSGQF